MDDYNSFTPVIMNCDNVHDQVMQAIPSCLWGVSKHQNTLKGTCKTGCGYQISHQSHSIIKLEMQYLWHLHNYTTARLVVVVVSHLMVQVVDVMLHCSTLSLSRSCLSSETLIV